MGIALTAIVSRGEAPPYDFSSRPGTVRAITGVAQAQSMTGVLQIAVATAVGASVNRVTSSWERVGQVMAMGMDGTQSAHRAEAAAAAIVIDTAAPGR